MSRREAALLAAPGYERRQTLPSGRLRRIGLVRGAAIAATDPVAVAVHVPHGEPLARQVTGPNDGARELIAEPALQLAGAD